MTDKQRNLHNEYVFKISTAFPCESLHESRMVTEFHNTVLAVYEKNEEIHFATAIYLENRSILGDWWYYGTDFEEAKKDFSVRSLLVSADEFLSDDEKLLVGDAIGNCFETNHFNEQEGTMAVQLSEKLNYPALSRERKENLEESNGYFNSHQLSVIVEVCEHRRVHTEVPDDYYQIVYDAETKVEKGQRYFAENPEDVPISNFTQEELLVIGDSCCIALDDWDNSHEYRDIFDEILEKIRYTELEKNRPEELDVEQWENEKEAEEYEDWEEDEQWEDEDER